MNSSGGAEAAVPPLKTLTLLKHLKTCCIIKSNKRKKCIKILKEL
jgi:hypothetical protein